jgi:transcriptional regulator with XRE-family HTH domain
VAPPAATARRVPYATSTPLRAPGRVNLQTRVARNLVLARHALGVTQEMLATRSGVSRATIAQLEAGANDSRLSTLSDIATALEISPALLFLSQADLAALARVIPRGELDRVLAHLPAGEVTHMNNLLASGLRRNLLEASLSGITAAEAAGFKSAGAIVGAGIGSTLAPGLGTAIGALFGAMWAGPQDSDTVFDGAGI